MRSFIRKLATAVSIWTLAVAPVLAPLPARAQYNDEATWGGTAGGAAGAQTVTINNWVRNGLVPIRFFPITNTGATTLAISGGTALNMVKWLPTGALGPLTGGEMQSATPAIVQWDGGTQYILLNPQLANVTGGSFAVSGLSPGAPPNFQLSASVASNNLTISVLNSAGANPSPASPVPLLFRDTTLTGGDMLLRSITTAHSFVINATNTMGCTSAIVCRLWVVEFDNAGTPVLCAFNAMGTAAPIQIATIDPAALQTSGAGTNGGSANQTYQCSVASLTNKAIAVLGYIEIIETTGNWNAAASKVQVWNPSIPLPGRPTGNVVWASTGTTASITPASIANGVKVSGNIGATLGASVSTVLTLKVGARTVASSTEVNGGASSGTYVAPMGPVLDNPQANTSTTYSGAASAGSLSQFGVYLEEIQG